MHYEELVDNVNIFEEEYELTELFYLGAIERLREVQNDVSKIDDIRHIRRVIKLFLIGWGMMNRVVGRQGLNWKKFGETLRSMEREFELLRDKKFLTINFDDKVISDAVITIYDKLDTFPYLGSPTTLSKILHLLNPEIFVMWDNAIEREYHRKNRHINYTAFGYLEFLRTTQKEILDALNERKNETGQTLGNIEKELRSKYKNKTTTKIIDEYNWIIVKR